MPSLTAEPPGLSSAFPSLAHSHPSSAAQAPPRHPAGGSNGRRRRRWNGQPCMDLPFPPWCSPGSISSPAHFRPGTPRAGSQQRFPSCSNPLASELDRLQGAVERRPTPTIVRSPPRIPGFLIHVSYVSEPSSDVFTATAAAISTMMNMPPLAGMHSNVACNSCRLPTFLLCH